jgi:hypothetical protein
MAQKKERLASDIMLDIMGHEQMVQYMKKQLAFARMLVEHYEKGLRQHENIVAELNEELKSL